MEYRPTQIERAFILAASGRVDSVADIKRALKAEGYLDEGQLHGSTITKQLSKLIAAAKGKATSGTGSLKT
jgi:hypothetical protein